jgi:proteasome accessory factor C
MGAELMTKSALDQLDRILYILPRAAAEGGVSITELAAELEVSPQRIVADVHEVLGRDVYHPASTGASVQACFSGDRLEVFTTGEFERPTRLSGPEALAVALSLRMRVAEDQAESLEVGNLRRIMSALEAQAGQGGSSSSSLSALSSTDQIHLEPIDPRDEIRDVIVEGHQRRHRCQLRYLSGRQQEPEVRTIHPYALAHGDGHWYVVGHCELRDEIRTFRFDHVIEAVLLGDSFEIPPDFDVGDFTRDGQVHDGSFGDEVEVIYSPGIARWVRERWMGEDRKDGAYAVRHRVSNTRWLTQHVLGYGGEAVVEKSGPYRASVSEAALRIAEGGVGTNSSSFTP